MINNYFDKAYCINLDRRPERWKEVDSEFKKHSLIVERVSAIDGNPDNIKTSIDPGAVGCILSHCKIVKEASESGFRQILIFEDDVVFDEELQEKFEQRYQQVPKDWDILYFGGNHNGIPLEMISENVGVTKKTYTTHAYAVKKSIFSTVINLFPKLIGEADVMYASLQKSFKCYVFMPHLAWQRNGFSDILKKNVNYDFLKTGFFFT